MTGLRKAGIFLREKGLARKLPRRKHITFRTRRKFEIKYTLAVFLTDITSPYSYNTQRGRHT